jgi:hypothetical protein
LVRAPSIRKRRSDNGAKKLPLEGRRSMVMRIALMGLGRIATDMAGNLREVLTS